MTSRTFRIFREHDVSKVSGTGFVAEGVVFSDGHAAIHWTGSRYPTTTPHPDGLDSVLYVHNHKGQGGARIVWDDDDVAPPSFGEEDVAFLHDILCMPAEVVSHGRARELLSKIRAAMRVGTVS